MPKKSGIKMTSGYIQKEKKKEKEKEKDQRFANNLITQYWYSTPKKKKKKKILLISLIRRIRLQIQFLNYCKNYI